MALGDATAEAGVGEVIGGYRLERLLGAGSTSQVYLGTHVRLGRAAAIKVLSHLLLDNKDVVSRLLQEARIVNDIRHPNIIDIVDFVETESPPRVALVMEYIEGPSLKALREHPLTYEQALGIALQLVVAVQAAHGAGVIHRDIKPDNLLLTRDPRNDPTKKVPRLKIVDFGIAKLAGSGGRTVTGMMLGTPAYMAPEQVAGRPPPSAATDVFAIGEVLYELVAGKRAYPAVAIHETVRAKLRGELPPLELPPTLPGRDVILQLVTRCLALKPQDRPSLAEVREKLVALAPQGESAARAKREGASIMRSIEPPTSQWLDALQEDIGASLPELADGPPTSTKTDEITSPPDPLASSGSLHAPTEVASPMQIATAEVPRPDFPVPAATEIARRIPVDHSSPTNRVLEALTATGSLPSAVDPTAELSLDRHAETHTSLDNQAVTIALDSQGVTGLDQPTMELGIPAALEGLRRSEVDLQAALGAELFQPVGMAKEGDRRPSVLASAQPALPQQKRELRPDASLSGQLAPLLGSAPTPVPAGSAPQARARAGTSSSKKGLLALIAALWLLASALIYLTLSLDKPAPQPPPKAGPVADPTTPGVQAHVHLSVHSVPAGARVEVVATGAELGKTPLELDVERAKSPKRLRISSDGYEPIEVDVIQASTRISVELEKR